MVRMLAYAPGPRLVRCRTRRPQGHRRPHRRAARRGVPGRRHPPALRHPQHGAAADRRHLRRGRRGARPPGLRQGAVRPGGAGPLRARRRLAGLGRRPSTTSPRSRRGSAASPCRATGTGPTASSCAGGRSASRACSPTRSCRSSSQWESPVEQHPSAGAHRRGARSARLEIAGDPHRVSDWLGNSVEGPLEDVKVEWVAPHGTPGVVAAQFSTPNGARPHLSGRTPLDGRRSRARTSGTTPRPTSSRTAPSTPTASSRPRCARCSATGWAGRDVLDLGCGTGFHLPRWAARRPARCTASSRTPTWPRSPPVVPRGCANVTVLPGTAQRVPLPARRVDVMQARWAYFFGPGCEPGLRELDRVMRRGGTAFVVDNDAVAQHVRVVVPARLPDRSTPDEVERFWSAHGWQRRAAGHASGGSRRARSSRPCVRIEFDARGRRRGARRPRRAPRWTTRSTCGGARTEAALSWSRGRSASGVEHAAGLAGSAGARAARRGSATTSTATSSSGCRTEVSAGRARPARRSSRRSRPRRRRGPARRPSSSRVRSTPIATVSLAQTNAVGRSARHVEQRARGPAAELQGVVAARGQPAGGQAVLVHPVDPAAAPVLADERALLPADPGDPLVAALDEVVDREHRPRRGRRRRPTGAGPRAPPRAGRTPRTARRARLEPGGVRVAAVGVGDHEGVDGRGAQQLVVPVERPRRRRRR